MEPLTDSDDPTVVEELLVPPPQRDLVAAAAEEAAIDGAAAPSASTSTAADRSGRGPLRGTGPRPAGRRRILQQKLAEVKARREAAAAAALDAEPVVAAAAAVARGDDVGDELGEAAAASLVTPPGEAEAEDPPAEGTLEEEGEVVAVGTCYAGARPRPGGRRSPVFNRPHTQRRGLAPYRRPPGATLVASVGADVVEEGRDLPRLHVRVVEAGALRQGEGSVAFHLKGMTSMAYAGSDSLQVVERFLSTYEKVATDLARVASNSLSRPE